MIFFLDVNPFKHLEKELSINGENFKYYDIASFKQFGKCRIHTRNSIFIHWNVQVYALTKVR